MQLSPQKPSYKVLRWIPEAQIGIAKLADGTRITINADSVTDVEQVARDTDNRRKVEKAEKDLAKLKEKADQAISRLEKKAIKALPDVLAHMQSVTYRASVPYYAALAAALERLM